MGTVDRSIRVTVDYYTDDNRGTGAAYHVSNRKSYKLARTRTGISNPSWKKSILNHVQAGTNLSGNFEALDASQMVSERGLIDANMPSPSIRIYKTRGMLTAYRFNQTKRGGTDLTSDAAVSLAMSKALKQIKSVQRKMSGSVFLGELREAAHMLRSPAEGLRKGIGKYLDDVGKRTKGFRKPSKDPDRWKRAISQSWLEGVFGWIPFVNDLEDAMEAYQKIRDEKADSFAKIRAIGKTYGKPYFSEDIYAPLADFYHLTVHKEFQEAICVIRGEVRSRAVATTVDKLKCFGLSTDEFLPTVWELIPWSFLVDYFTNIGDIIENSMTSTSDVTWLMQSTVVDRIYQGSTRAFKKGERGYNSDSLWVSGSQDFCSYKWRTVSRAKDPLLRVPPLTLELPGSPMKQLNMLALWVQANAIHPQNTRMLRGRHIS